MFCLFRTYLHVPIGHVTIFAGGERRYNVSKLADVRRETASLNSFFIQGGGGSGGGYFFFKNRRQSFVSIFMLGVGGGGVNRRQQFVSIFMYTCLYFRLLWKLCSKKTCRLVQTRNSQHKTKSSLIQRCYLHMIVF